MGEGGGGIGAEREKTKQKYRANIKPKLTKVRLEIRRGLVTAFS